MTETARDPREAKLPKWVQDELDQLRRMLSELQHERAVFTGTQPARAWLDGIHGDLPLPEGDIEFLLGPKDYHRIQVGLRKTNRGTVLNVSGFRSIHVLPQSGNLIEVLLDD